MEITSLRWWGEQAASAFEPVSDFLVAPLFANPGERRGLITAFSPVADHDRLRRVLRVQRPFGRRIHGSGVCRMPRPGHGGATVTAGNTTTVDLEMFFSCFG